MRNTTRFAALALTLGAACSAPRLDVTPRWGPVDIEGHVAGAAAGSPLLENDLETIGLQEDDSVIGAVVDFDWGPNHLSISLQGSSHDGDGVLEADLDLGDDPLFAGEAIASELELGLYGFAWTFDVLPTQMWELGLGLGLVAVDMDAAFESKGTGDRAETDQTAPIPVIAARFGVDLGRVELAALANGMSVSYDDDDLSFFDLEAAGRVHLLGGDDRVAGYLGAGYRWTSLTLEYEDGGDLVDADMTFQGPWLGVVVSF